MISYSRKLRAFLHKLIIIEPLFSYKADTEIFGGLFEMSSSPRNDFTFLLTANWAETSAIHLSDYPLLNWPVFLTSTYHVIPLIKLLYIIADSEGGLMDLFFFYIFYYG